MTIIDAANNLIINEKVVDSEDFDKNTIKKFLKRSLEGLKLEAIITDGHQAYPSIIEALGAITTKMRISQNANTNEKSKQNHTTSKQKKQKK